MKDTSRLEAQAQMDTPLGPLTLFATAKGLAGASFHDQKYHPGLIDAPANPRHPHLAPALDELQHYFAGHGAQHFSAPLDLAGTPFQRNVWLALLHIAPGRTRSYGEVAQAVGAPAAVRAVGAAVGRNPLSIIVPCHRVVGHNGSLTGYAGGLHRKQALLALESGSRTLLET
jgi:methylated-DNA-[protein]-cysteine S-methyltransferase